MKTILMVIMFLSVNVALAEDFCDGFEAGYKQGVCNGRASCIEPMSPICPLPMIGQDEFKHGYNRGFIQGLGK